MDSHRGYPKLSTFFENRSYFFSTLADKDYVFGSLLNNIFHLMGPYFLQDINGDPPEAAETGTRTDPADVTGNNYFNYVGVDNVKAFSFAIGGNEANEIQWVRSNSSFLQIGTLASEHILYGTDGVLGEINVLNKIQTNQGGSEVNALGVGNTSFYVSKDGKSLREFVYNEENGSFISSDISFLSTEILKHTFDEAQDTSYNTIEFKQQVYHQLNSCIWMVTSQNALICLVYDRIMGMRAWSRFSPAGTNAKIHSIAVIPTQEGTQETLYCLVSRTVNSTTKWTIEKMVPDFEHGLLTANQESDWCYYFDGGFVSVLTAASNTISGLDHLEGESLGVLVNGLPHGDVTVSSGTITLDSTYPIGTVIALGLSYEGEIEFFPPEAGGDFGQSTGLIKRIDRLMIGLWNSLGLKVSSNGVDYEDCDEIEGYPYTAVTNTFTGDIIKYFDGDNDNNERLYLKQDRPYPCNITSVFMRGVTHD
jgi:hypothetical protein